MAVGFRIDKVVDDQYGFRVEYTFGTLPLPIAPMGIGVAFQGKQQLRDWVLQLETDYLQGRDDLLKILVGMWHARNAGLDNFNLIEGKTIGLDLAAANVNNVIRVQ